MARRKIAVVVASRANYGRIKSVLRAVQDHPDLELQLIVGASALLSRFGSVVEVIRRDGFEPAATVHMIVEGENPTTMAKSTGLGLLELPTILGALRPDIVLTVADRFETMATAVAAAYMNIPLAHTQGGEVTGSIDESVRHAVTKLAHLHFPATERAAERVIKMGEDPATVHTVGCPAIDLAAAAVADRPRALDFDLFAQYGGVGPRLDLSGGFLLVLQHPVTTEFGSGLAQITATLEAVRRVELPTVWFWPNVDAGSDEVSKGIRLFREEGKAERVHFFRNLPPEEYVRVLHAAACIVGNSSSGIREGAFLGTPCVNVGTRQAGRERGANVRDVGHAADAIAAAVTAQAAHGPYPPDHRYGDGKAGARIADVLSRCEVRVQKRLCY